MISYHNPVTKRSINIYPVRNSRELKHMISKRSDEEMRKVENIFEEQTKEKRSELENKNLRRNAL